MPFLLLKLISLQQMLTKSPQPQLDLLARSDAVGAFLLGRARQDWINDACDNWD